MAYHHNSLAEGQILALLHRPAQITGKTGDINVRSWHEADIDACFIVVCF
jgi:hypothetical protein